MTQLHDHADAPTSSSPTLSPTSSHVPSAGRRTPVSTYRLQLGPDLTFDQAIGHLDYLEDLGVTDLYLSPILQSAPGSTHGYDVVDHTRINEAMGGREGFERLATAAHERDMGIVVDVVPNHMGVPTPLYHNKALWSVLQQGPESPYAAWFDGTDAGDEGILMPVLGARIGTVLDSNEITLERRVVPGFEDAGEQPVLVYYDHVFPVRAGTENLPMPLCVAEQFYRLAYWKVSDEELNFRRFFDVDTLVAVRVEDPDVFDGTHALLLDLFRAGHIDGFRIDHPDGLADPRGYMRRLSMATGGAFIAAEKILEGGESMPDDWPVAGSTGYDTAWRIQALQVEAAGYGDLGTIAHVITGDIPGSLADVIEQAKREIATTSLFAEVHRIATLAHAICRADIMLRDHTFTWIRECVTELVIAVDRYRAYVVPGEPASQESIELIEEAAATARGRLEADYHDTLEVVVDLVLGREVGSQGRVQQAVRDELVVRFQQVCGAVTAKGVEDTAFYRWTHLVALNEVGGAPDTWGLSPDTFHAWLSQMTAEWPDTMTCGTTHDTKRSEDVRSRIGILAQYAAEWRALLTKLHPLAEAVEGHTENLMWQILAGTWTPEGPIAQERLTDYLLKAAREQKLWTSWTKQDAAREQALTDFISELYGNDDVMGAFADWYAFTDASARVAILTRKTIQLTCLGVADTYSSTETTQNYLVDPDNRGPFDWDALAGLARTLDGREPQTLAEEKFHLTREILRLRRRRPHAFVGPTATYRPLPSSTGHAVCYARGTDVVTVAIRLHRSFAEQSPTQHAVVLPAGRWRNVFTGAEFDGGSASLTELVGRYPAAALERTGGGDDAADADADALASEFTAGGPIFRAQPADPARRGRPAAETEAESSTESTGLLGWLSRRFFERGDTGSVPVHQPTPTDPDTLADPERDHRA
ncbi:malto-oligosyltrehalose synthase [Propioniciclava soli]|uniref:malto-oligosyltrehalose synthase n=1 Tax=Propioniciclava soli TaxID=2775081 RepID=UPI001E3F3532|nr:malto-oligosyltrehalose synthase [Propioniciclava soli]